MPRYSSTWDINLVLSHMKSLGSNKYLPLYILSQKLVMLLLLLSGKRIQSIRAMKISAMILSTVNKTKQYQFYFHSLLKHSRPKFKQKPLTFREYPDKLLCPVDAIDQYLSRRNSLSKADPFFIATKPPFQAAHKDTLARWVIMASSGIDTSIFLFFYF